jgi:hypothetical protein
MVSAAGQITDLYELVCLTYGGDRHVGPHSGKRCKGLRTFWYRGISRAVCPASGQSQSKV